MQGKERRGVALSGVMGLKWAVRGPVELTQGIERDDRGWPF